ncbi:MAG: phosphoesterase PA-phosphatase related protein [Labilithrix sp.]|nr:phosphoesterase PA-phosphatase related protein [Labilithrix sp.]
MAALLTALAAMVTTGEASAQGSGNVPGPAGSAPVAAPGTTPAPGSVAAPNGPDGKAPMTATTEEVQPAKDPARNTDLVPQVAQARPAGRVTFDVDPIADIGVIAVSMGFAGVLELINGTGEIRPQPVSADFHRNQLLGIDRGALSQTPDSKAGSRSTIGLAAAVAFAFIDPVLSGFREKSVQTGLVDGILYAESLSLTIAATDMVKMAVRRPRPFAYIDAEAHKGDPNFVASTNSGVSFFSGHASMVAAVGGTATYLAFARSPHTVRPWITLIAAAGLSTFVSIERVRSGAHFPTDVIAGSIAGAGIGVVVPHLHRSEDIKQRRVWVGYAAAPATDGYEQPKGGVLTASGFF